MPIEEARPPTANGRSATSRTIGDVKPPWLGGPRFKRGRRKRQRAKDLEAFQAEAAKVFDLYHAVLERGGKLSERDVLAALLVGVVKRARRWSHVLSGLKQLGHVYGHDSSTLRVERELPSAETIQRWKAEVAAHDEAQIRRDCRPTV